MASVTGADAIGLSALLVIGTVIAEVRACQGCGACLLTCPEHAIRPSGGTLDVLADRCSGCGECVEVCPVDAIVLVDHQGGDVT